MLTHAPPPAYVSSIYLMKCIILLVSVEINYIILLQIICKINLKYLTSSTSLTLGCIHCVLNIVFSLFMDENVPNNPF